MTHGHAPRVRRTDNESELQGGVTINSELLLNKTVDAALTAGVSLAVAQLIKE